MVRAAGTGRRPPGHAKQPARERRPIPDCRRSLVEGDKRGLEGIFGRGVVAKHLPARGQDQRPVPAHQSFERIRITLAEKVGKELSVGPLAEPRGVGRDPDEVGRAVGLPAHTRLRSVASFAVQRPPTRSATCTFSFGAGSNASDRLIASIGCNCRDFAVELGYNSADHFLPFWEAHPMRKLFIPMALFAVMVVLGQSSAQFDPETQKLSRSVQRVLGDNPGALAMNPGVQKELKMDDDQVKAVQEKVAAASGFGGFGKGKGGFDDAAKERFGKYMEKVQALKDVPEDKLDDKIRETFKEELEGPAKEVEKILKPEQMTRLAQIGRQQGGPRAYLKPENVKDLGITDEQKTKLRSISTELEKDVGELRRSGGKGGFNISPETREKIESLTKEANEKATALLTDEQKSKWKTLIGEPYTVRFAGFRPKKDD
jgi:hypothetical protein